ncbi:type II secretion system F family protein [Paraburkholderia dinghuensis]|uniref:Type II secretion system F family protein n=1 Tax=Paraburkholderia dinghuensis TaxID=2305225 RepID=A0A3N6NI12_9BURK|nr:type II secretion system F family protein [Paraburkholderia dinghuensis]RQH08387.1 type II secretion system F family protein [Paraburkholderia dinghuensis]
MDLFHISMSSMLLLGGVFVIVFALAFAAMHFVASRDLSHRIGQPGAAPVDSRFGNASDAGAGDGNVWFERLVEFSRPISKLSVPKEGWEGSALRVRLMNAGWRAPGAGAIYFAAKTVLALVLPLLAAIWLFGSPTSTSTLNFTALLVALGAVGYYLPNVIVARRVEARQRTIFEDFPDAIDLMTVCVEAGLGLDAALMKVAEEVRLRSPDVADELELLLLEIRSGFSKEKALRNFSLRTGVEDIDSFATMLIQAERFGTSIGSSLRVLSDTLRVRRRMRAEEQAAKIALKLLFPLMFCIFPSLMVVLMGPAMLHIYRSLLPAMGGG